MRRKHFAVQHLVGRCNKCCPLFKEAAYVVIDMAGLKYGEYCKEHAEQAADEAEKIREEYALFARV